MNSLWQIIRKNLLLLLRSRSSAFVIIFGPLFIILLIGLAFTTPSSYDLVVGYYAPEDSVLMNRFVQNMQASGFLVEGFESVAECTNRMELGSVQSCIVFPEDFRIANNHTNELVFFVDPSRTNFVYQIIESVSSNVGLESTQVSEDLTNDILEVMWSTEEGVDEALAQVIKLKTQFSPLDSAIDQAASDLEGIDLESQEVQTTDLQGQYKSLMVVMDELREESDDLMGDGRSLVNQLQLDAYVHEELSDFNDSLNSFSTFLDDNEQSGQGVEEAFLSSVDDLESSLGDLSEKFSDAGSDRDDVVEQIESLKGMTASLKDGLDDVKSQLESVNAGIDTLKVTSSDTISRPITTKIEHLTTRSNKLSYMFPYLLMLVVLFIGLLLSGTLVVMEKRSKSSFRTFCTPTSDGMFITGNFLTSFIVLVVQMGLLLGFAYYFLGPSLLGNIKVSLFLLFLGVVFFILLGMALGYLFSTQEAVTMVAISLGSIFLFLSNLILPLETLSEQLRYFTSFNPYVITSEALRKAMLFGTPLAAMQREVIMLIAYSVIIFVVTIVAKNIMKAKFFLYLTSRKHSKLLSDPSDMYLRLDRRHVKDLDDLLSWLKDVDDKHFERELPWSELRDWLKRNNHERWLRVALAGKKRKRMIEVLQKHLEKKEKDEK